MRLTPLIRSAVLLMALFGFASVVQADPITYRISGIASGTIGGTTFTNAAVEFIGTANTADVSSFPVVISGNSVTVFGNPVQTFTVTIGGVGTATITDQSALWTIPAGGVVLFGREDHVGGVPVLDSITGLGLITSNSLAGYEGMTAVGPITDSGGIGFPACGGVGQDPCVDTTLGLLSFTTNIHFPPGAETKFSATLAPVPEPPPVVLMLSALGLVAVWRMLALKLTAGHGTNR